MGQSINVLAEVPRAGIDKPPRFYRPELDGLRFYAFLGVFVCHTFPPWDAFYARLHAPVPWLWAAVIRSGAAGVDLFFALSAFLITSLLVQERRDTGGISLRLFYIRRVLRIWPLYFLILALGMAAALPRLNQSRLWYYDQSLPWYYVVGYMLFVGNWIAAIFGTPESICSPLWTVSIEEQFYLFWPALMSVLKRRGMIIAGIVIFFLSMVGQIGTVLCGANTGYIYFGSASRCDSLALGMLLALYTDRLPKLTRGTRFLLVACGLTGWIISSAWLADRPGPANMRTLLGRLIVSLASGAILYGCLNSTNRLVTGGWVVRLGKISYGLYMWHFTGLLILLSLLRPTYGWKLLAAKALAFVLTVFLASASYRWIESPFLRLKDRFAIIPSRPV
jgi:peptidoglycan/LPS O-acetylase OafA/YrhL